MMKVFSSLFENKEYKLLQKENVTTAHVYVVHGLLTKALKALTINLIRSREKQAIAAYFQMRQRQIYLPTMFAVWFARARAAQISRNNQAVAERFRV